LCLYIKIEKQPTLVDSFCDLRFRKIKSTFFNQINQLIIWKKISSIIDASVIDIPLNTKGKSSHKIAEDRVAESEQIIPKEYSSSVGKEASWLKKGEKYHYGYRKHYLTDEEGLVLGVLTTKASTNEIAILDEVLDTADLPKGIPLKRIRDTSLKRMLKY
jgi:IS5 family transposase